MENEKIEQNTVPAKETIVQSEQEIKPEVKLAVKQEVMPEAKPEPKKYAKDIHINVLEDRRCYRKTDLIPEEIKYRIRKGYHESEQWDIESGKSETYLLKPRSNESDSHLFLIYRIADYIYQYTNKVLLFETNNPDIIFETPDGRKVAIEVETGQMYTKARKHLYTRIKLLKKEYGRNWFFVVTNSDWLKTYQKLGPAVTRKEVIAKLREFFPMKESKTPSNGDIRLKTPQIKEERT
jgi:hypothetical protein